MHPASGWGGAFLWAESRESISPPSLHLVTLGNMCEISRDIGRVKQSQLPSGLIRCLVYTLVKQGRGGWSREKQYNVHKMQNRFSHPRAWAHLQVVYF